MTYDFDLFVIAAGPLAARFSKSGCR
jgi:hypothetical protein